MSIYEVPREQWVAFCERMSRQERGSKLTIELIANSRDPDPARQPVAVRQPLALLSIADGGRLRVALDNPPREVELRAPTRLAFVQHGASACGEIYAEAEGGRSMLIRFDHPVVPGELDHLP